MNVMQQRNLTAALTSALLIISATDCYAPVYGLYTGIPNLERKARAIAVVELVPPPPQKMLRDFQSAAGIKDPRQATTSSLSPAQSQYLNQERESVYLEGHFPRLVRVKRVLKGPLVDGQETTMSLRFLSGEAPDIAKSALQFDTFRPTKGCFLVFLESETDLRSINSVGAIISVSCTQPRSHGKSKSVLEQLQDIVPLK